MWAEVTDAGTVDAADAGAVDAADAGAADAGAVDAADAVGAADAGAADAVDMQRLEVNIASFIQVLIMHLFFNIINQFTLVNDHFSSN